jgi:hypothetical protein
MPDVAPPEPTETCPGCGIVLVRTPDGPSPHPGASTSCARLFGTTLRGIREEAAADPSAAATLALADATYAAQHARAGGEAVARLAEALGETGNTPAGTPPRAWRTTIADVAADLDVIDLAVLVEAWARAVHQDWDTIAAGV